MKQIKKLLAGLLTAALLVSLVSMAFAASPSEDLLDILEQMYEEQNGARRGISLFSLDGNDGDVPSYVPEKADTVNTAVVTVGEAEKLADLDGTVQVPVYVTASAGVIGVQMSVTYGAGLTYVEAAAGREFDYRSSVTESAAENTLSLMFVANETLEPNKQHLLTTLTFTTDGVDPGSTAAVTGAVQRAIYWATEDNVITAMVYQNENVTVEDGAVRVPTTAAITIGGEGLTAQAGDTVTVPVSISADYPGGVNGIQMTIIYDEKVLSIDAADATAAVMTLDDESDGFLNLTTEDAKFVGDADKAQVKAIVNTTDGQLDLSLMWVNNENIQLDGQIAALTFTVNENLTEDTSTKISGSANYVTYEASEDDFKHEYDNVSVTGCNVALTAAPAYTLGDVNGDGTIDSADAVLVLQYEAKAITADTEGVTFIAAAADVNNDGAIDSADAVQILQYEAKVITEFVSAE